MDYAAAVNEEIRDLFAAGADVVQIDEPYMQARPDEARAYRAEGAQPRARWHQRHDRRAYLLRLRGDHSRAARRRIRSCRSSRAAAASRCRSRPRSRSSTVASLAPLAGQEDHARRASILPTMTVETPETVAARIRRALPFVAAENIIVAPDCGMKYLPREVAFGKLKAMVAGAAIVRDRTNQRARVGVHMATSEGVDSIAEHRCLRSGALLRLDAMAQQRTGRSAAEAAGRSRGHGAKAR